MWCRIASNIQLSNFHEVCKVPMVSTIAQYTANMDPFDWEMGWYRWMIQGNRIMIFSLACTPNKPSQTSTNWQWTKLVRTWKLLSLRFEAILHDTAGCYHIQWMQNTRNILILHNTPKHVHGSNINGKNKKSIFDLTNLAPLAGQIPQWPQS